MIKQAVILAGGLGTRLRPITNNTPKPMIRFHGKPFLEYLIIMLRGQGVSEVVLLLGYLSDQIVDYFKDGKNFGVDIKYSISHVEDDTGSRLKKGFNLYNDEFLLMYCDNYWPLELKKMYSNYKKNNKDAQITIYNNKDMYTKNNCKVSKEGLLEIYDKTKTDLNLNGVDIGFLIIKKNLLKLLPEGNINFEKELLPILVKNSNIGVYKTNHKYYSIGSLERLPITEKFLKCEPAIILDRDGVLNKKANKGDYIKSINEFEWIPKSIEALKILSVYGYKLIIVTNQAGIARNLMTEEDLTLIHKKMEEDLSEFGIKIAKIYYCPHGWDDNCECRKPKTGMLYQAQKDFHLDLTKTYFIGDDERDKIAGDAAGMITVNVDERNNLYKFVKKLENEINR